LSTDQGEVGETIARDYDGESSHVVLGHWTTTCRATLLLMLPEVAVIVTAYVPDGVPGVVWVDDEPLPPHDINNAKASTTIGATRTVSRLRFRTQSQVDPSNSNNQVRGIIPGGKLMGEVAAAVTGAVVPTLTVTVCVPLPLICTEELDRAQVGGGVTAGVIAQLRSTVPVNDPVGPMARLKFAVCPALMLWEVGEPEEAPREKPGAA
jgi:hypothetical protein